MAIDGKRESKQKVDKARRNSAKGKEVIRQHAVSEHGHLELLKNSCVSTHMRELSVTTDESAQDSERDQVRACAGVCGNNTTDRFVQLCFK